MNLDSNGSKNQTSDADVAAKYKNAIEYLNE